MDTLPLPLLTNAHGPILRPETILQVRNVVRNGGQVQQVLVKWESLPSTDNTWEDVTMILNQYPDLDLEDKVIGKGGGIVTDIGEIVGNSVKSGNRVAENREENEEEGGMELGNRTVEIQMAVDDPTVESFAELEELVGDRTVENELVYDDRTAEDGNRNEGKRRHPRVEIQKGINDRTAEMRTELKAVEVDPKARNEEDEVDPTAPIQPEQMRRKREASSRYRGYLWSINREREEKERGIEREEESEACGAPAASGSDIRSESLGEPSDS